LGEKSPCCGADVEQPRYEDGLCAISDGDGWTIVSREEADYIFEYEEGGGSSVGVFGPRFETADAAHVEIARLESERRCPTCSTFFKVGDGGVTTGLCAHCAGKRLREIRGVA
jgi:hypothetical protein